MSTTTGRDLLERAERIALDLAHCDLPVSTSMWESFDTTTYRLLREVIGPSRNDSGGSGRTRARLLQLVHAYPTPLRPPLDTVLTARAAARFFPGSQTQFNYRLRRGQFEADPSDDAFAIESRVLDRRPDITPADPTHPYPLARLAVTLGALADMVSQERRQPHTPDVLDDTVAVDVAIRVLACTSVAARYTLRHGPVADGGRPLAVAQYAERAVDTLGGRQPTTALDALVARVETGGACLNDRLDDAIHRWAAASRSELSRAVPPTQVIANIADLGAMMLATTHHLHGLSPGTSAAEHARLTHDLRSAADALKSAATAWKKVTTLQPQSHEFGNASLELFKCLREILGVSPSTVERTTPALDVTGALRIVALGVGDLRRLVTQSQEATMACLNSGLLFAPRRAVSARSSDHGVEARLSHTAMDRRVGLEILGPIQPLPSKLQNLQLRPTTDRFAVERSL